MKMQISAILKYINANYYHNVHDNTNKVAKFKQVEQHYVVSMTLFSGIKASKCTRMRYSVYWL